MCPHCKTNMLGAMTHHAPICTRCSGELRPVTRNEDQTRQLAAKLHMDVGHCACGLHFLRRFEPDAPTECPSCWLDTKAEPRP